MNLTGQSVYEKGQRLKKNPNRPTATQKARYDQIAQIGCIVCWRLYGYRACNNTTIHHCFTGAGGRKDHDKTIPLCWNHHCGAEGIDGKRMSKREWQERFGAEQDLLDETNRILRASEGK